MQSSVRSLSLRGSFFQRDQTLIDLASAMPCWHRDMFQLCGYWAVSQRRRCRGQSEQVWQSAMLPVRLRPDLRKPGRPCLVPGGLPGLQRIGKELLRKSYVCRWERGGGPTQAGTGYQSVKWWSQPAPESLKFRPLYSQLLLFWRKHCVWFFPGSVPGESGKPWEKQETMQVSIWYLSSLGLRLGRPC